MSDRGPIPPAPRTLAGEVPETIADDDPYATRLLDDGPEAHTPRPPGDAVPGSGRFRILRPHANGGLGAVYVARDEELNRDVALKEILTHRADDPGNRSRFLMEAEVTGRLEHPGIVPVYGLGRYNDGRPYYAMRFIEGDSLHDAIRRFHEADEPGQAPGERVVAFRGLLRRFVDMCNAMAYAHSRGVLHRDLKPANVMLGKFGETLVVDWGLAKVVGRPDLLASVGGQAIQLSADSGVAGTMAGVAIGTPQYMSPEQAVGDLDRIGPATDIYSLGATLYTVLTGQAAFRDRDLTSMLGKVGRGEFPPPREVRPDVPRALEAICLKAMALRPEDRYATSRALAEEVEHWLADEPVTAYREGLGQRVTRWARRHRTWTRAGAAALLVVVSVSVVANLLVNRARQRAERFSAGLSVDRGLALCDRGEAGRGLLWLARSLEITPSSETDLHRVIRANLAGWGGQVRPLREILEHTGIVVALQYSGDGRTILTGSSDPGGDRWSSRLWDAATGRPLGPAIEHQGAARAMAFSPDGRSVLTGGRDGTARLWDTATGEPIGPPLGHESPVTAVVFSPDGRLALIGSERDGARLWEVATGEPVGLPLEHRGQVVAVAFSPDGRHVATGGADRTARLWDAATGRPVGSPLVEHQDWVQAVAFSPDGRTVLTATSRGIVRLWDMATGRQVARAPEHYGPVTAVAFSPDGRFVLTGGESNNAHLWEIETGRSVGLPLEHRGTVTSVAFSPDGRTLLTGSRDRTARLWDAATGGRDELCLAHQDRVRAVAFSPDGRLVLTGSLDATAQLWDATTGKRIGGPLAHEAGVTAVAFSPDGKLVLTGSLDATARLWDAATGRPIGEALAHGAGVTAVAFSPDGKLFLTGSEDGSSRRWDAATGEPVGPHLEHRGPISAVAFSPDGKLFVTGSEDGSSLRWDAATGKPVGLPLEHRSPVTAVAFSPDGRLVLTGSEDNGARLWDAATARPIGPPLEHRATVRAVAFSPDGRTLLTGSRDGTARLWDAATGRPIGPPLNHQSVVSAVAFGPDGRHFLTGSGDKTARLWEIPTPLACDVEKIVLWAQVIAGQELDTSGNPYGEVRGLEAPAWNRRRDGLSELGGPPPL